MQKREFEKKIKQRLYLGSRRLCQDQKDGKHLAQVPLHPDKRDRSQDNIQPYVTVCKWTDTERNGQTN